jgi:sporulation protein YlmC with PRC-barrel domain
MLWNASKLSGYAVEANDGLIGTVSDFLFEDRTWQVRWLVVETGNWFANNKVLLPLSTLGYPHQTQEKFSVSLTRQQVKDSPRINTDLPISREMESSIYDFYGWDPYWSGLYALGGAMPAMMKATIPIPRNTANKAALLRPADQHLLSVDTIAGYYLEAADGTIGHVDDFLIDDTNWHIRYLIAATSNWWPGKSVVLSSNSVKKVDWAERIVKLDVNRSQVRGSPRYDPGTRLDKAYQERLLEHYGLENHWP